MIHKSKSKKPVAETEALPTEFALENNYPNPFNPSTSISFDIPVDNSGYVSLKVYDLRGALVNTLVE